MTANAQWKEILDALEPGQKAEDRPDLTCRVFKMKLDELLLDLIQHKIFGSVAGYAWTIEYQKRGLPHVHILLVLKDKQDKARIPAHIDRIISAEIPDKRTEPELYKAVKAFMIHGPCGDHNKTSPCMLNPKCMGQCFRSFPKKEARETVADVTGFPEYRRRLTGSNAHTIPEIGVHRDINSSWVVPYNPYLLQKFQTHINVEISTSIKSFKYIYKYIHKGGDKAEIRLRTINEEEGPQTYADLDELKNWADSRYISAHEAIWRLLEYPTNSLSHVVHRLSLHLPGQHNVVFTEENMERVVDQDAEQTTLTSYLALNEGSTYSEEEMEIARNTLYHDIPKYFTWQTDTKRWQLRAKKLPTEPVMYWNSNKPIIGRIYQISPVTRVIQFW
jgi:hypothetical protein